MAYVDGFVIPVPKAKVVAYEKMARAAGAIWKELGALAFVECVGDDIPYGNLTSFPRAVQVTEDETVIFSWIVYRSKAERDEINGKIMADPRIKEMMNDPVFDGKRMIYGGFETICEM